jgi:rod shape-determining protein MreD
MLTPWHRLLATLPGVLALLLLLLAHMPLETGMMLAPNVVWAMTLAAGMQCQRVWPLGLAFGLGLLADVATGTPLGAQALLAMMLTLLVRRHARRLAHSMFRVQWLEATGALVAAHFLLWVLLQLMRQPSPPAEDMLFAGMTSGLWYPVFYMLLRPVALRMPAGAAW